MVGIRATEGTGYDYGGDWDAVACALRGAGTYHGSPRHQAAAEGRALGGHQIDSLVAELGR
jgi:hypothetical protein